MFILYGRRKLRIKRYAENQHSCSSCGTFDLDVKVFKEYFHVFYIPFAPAGVKSTSMRCKNCCQAVRIDSLQKQYEDKTRTPFYLYLGLILIGCLISLAIIVNLYTQREKRKFVENPQVGDVYTVSRDTANLTEYYFLRISRIKGDSIFAYHSNLIYRGYVYQFGNGDFFVKDEELLFTRQELLRMLEVSEINSVNRHYNSSDGFNRIE